MLSKELTLDLVRVTEAAALGSGRWIGKGRKNDADGAAVCGCGTGYRIGTRRFFCASFFSARRSAASARSNALSSSGSI